MVGARGDDAIIVLRVAHSSLSGEERGARTSPRVPPRCLRRRHCGAPDEGYLIPDEEWEGMVDPETGETFYPGDPYASYRLELIRMQQDYPISVVRPGYEERLERLKKLREAALNARVGAEIESFDQ